MKNFSGWSGSNIELRDNRIYKTGGPRLIKQAQKQLLFASIISTPALDIPHIFSFGDSHIEMEYCCGKTFTEYANLIDASRLTEISNILLGFVQANITTSTLITVSKNIFYEKIREISKKLPANTIPSFKFEDIYLPAGLCHGDLTLSNLIFSDSKIWLIDFLDSYIESPIMDLIKLLQDTKEKLILLDNVNPRLNIILNQLNKKILDAFKNYGYERYYPQLQFVNLARILPYVANDKFQIIKNKIEALV